MTKQFAVYSFRDSQPTYEGSFSIRIHGAGVGAYYSHTQQLEDCARAVAGKDKTISLHLIIAGPFIHSF